MTTRVERLVVKCAINTDKRSVSPKPSLMKFVSLGFFTYVALEILCDVPSSVVETVLKTCEGVRLFAIDLALEVDDDKSIIPSMSHSMRYLELPVIIPFLAQPPQLGYLRSLRHLSSSFGGVPAPDRDTFFAACAPTLEILEISFDMPFALPALPALMHLELRIHSDVARIAGAIPRAVFVALDATPHLKHLTVALYERETRHSFDGGILARARAPEWLVLEKRLSEMHVQDVGRSPSRTENINQRSVEVHFSLRYLQDNPRRYASFIADVKARLPRLLDAGNLAFSNRVAFERRPFS
ncbi:hypothetical protein C8R45DRAFT_1224407 [Mycena sanguinolenta]|nr:hypothetical protein C8R45DRAFT_1224407 [Mycena sanguinolenta]